ncbi:C40 family peptidase [Macrococcus equipercicus]|uniref:C40 family peptidase n=1 Tax=Macrococcus equipercicus TaxID=69967 RepID=A0A9Q9F1X8_9STAP|nr:C40 family peptidase [Macrococcus equipercicus]UTH14230.1 C40 family peptidase [Macrococcus equipercicus]
MKKTIIALSTLAGLTVAGNHHADAAAYGKGTPEAQAHMNNATSTSYNYNYSNDYKYNYTYTANADGSTVYNYNYGSNNNFRANSVTTEANADTTQTTVRNFNQNTTYQKAVSTTTSAAVNNNVASVANSMAATRIYVYGANTSTAVDCSSFAQQVLAAMGKSIPRTTYAQMAAGTPVSNPQPGDLVFFNDGSHVGVYIGGGMMVDALNPAEGVGERAVSYVDGTVTGYYRF